LAASTTTMPAHSPEMSRLRRGKKRARGAWAGGSFATKAPCAREGAASATRSRGETRGGPPARPAPGPVAGGAPGGGGGRRAAGGGAGEAGEAGAAESACQPLGKAQARGRGIAGADDGDRRQMQRRGLAADGKKRRGVVDHLQPAWIVGLRERDESDAEGFRRLELTLGVLAGMDAGGTARAAAAGGVRPSPHARAGAALVGGPRRGGGPGPTGPAGWG